MASTPELSEAEQRFDALRRKIGLVGAPIVFVGLYVAPLDLPAEAHALAAVFATIVLLWITEAIPLAASALLGPAMAALLGVADPDVCFAKFSDPLIFLFLGGFLLAAAMARQGLDRRIALWLIGRKVVGGSPARATVAVAVVAYCLSMWISNTATTAMLIPVALGLYATTCRATAHASAAQLRRYGGGMCLTLAYAASLGGAATPIGTGPNVIAISMFDELLGVHVDFGQWMAIAVPTTLALLVVTISITHRRFPAPVAEVSQLRAEIRKQLEQLGTMSAAEWKVVVVFALAICGWLGPSLVKLALGAQHPSLGWARTHLDEGVVAIVATGCLFFMRGSTDERGDVHRLLAPDDVQQVDWGTLLLLGGGMALGSLTFSTGLAAAIGEGIVDLTGDLARHPLGLAAAASLLVLFLTEVTSNTATVSMMLPVLLGVAAASGVDPLPTGIAVTLAGSFAFMLPVSTPPNAIAYGTKMIRIDDMIRTGFKLDLVGYVVLLLAAAFLIPAVI